MPDVPNPPQVPLSSHAAAPSLDAGDLIQAQEQAQARARLLVRQLEAFDDRSQRDSHWTFVVCILALGLMASAAGLYAWLGAGQSLLEWHHLPLAGGFLHQQSNLCHFGLQAPPCRWMPGAQPQGCSHTGACSEHYLLLRHCTVYPSSLKLHMIVFSLLLCSTAPRRFLPLRFLKWQLV